MKQHNSSTNQRIPLAPHDPLKSNPVEKVASTEWAFISKETSWWNSMKIIEEEWDLLETDEPMPINL